MSRCFPCLARRSKESAQVPESTRDRRDHQSLPDSARYNLSPRSIDIEGGRTSEAVNSDAAAQANHFDNPPSPTITETQVRPNISFPYPPLQHVEGEFRLLVIKAGQEGDTIECTLSNALHSDNPVYSALSYCWGSMSLLKSVHVNGHLFELGLNCEAAIRMLRQRDMDVSVWIDSICINQNSIEDRNTQVRQMRRKYQDARDVVVWLGEAEADSGEAVKILEQISKMGRYNTAQSSKTIGTDLQWAAVRKFFKIPWFERVWIVQEVALAKAISIHIGPYTIEWSTFVKAIQWYIEDIDFVYKSIVDSDSFFNNACSLREAWARRTFLEGSADSIQFLLGVFGHWKATCPSDKVYGLLGLSNEHDAEGLLVDYDLSITQIFSNVVRFHIERDRRLDILAQCHNPPIFQGLPSWVPDWTPDRMYRQTLSESYRPPGSAKVLFQPADEAGGNRWLIPVNLPLPAEGYGTWEQSPSIPLEMNFSATLHTKTEFKFPAQENMPSFRCLQGADPSAESIMVLAGCVVDEIESVSKPLFRPKEDVDDSKFMLEWEEFALLSPLVDGVECPYGGTLEARIEVYWRTLITDRIFQSRGNIRATKQCGRLFEQWRLNMINNADPADVNVPVTEATVDFNDPTSASQFRYNKLATESLSQIKQNAAKNAFFLDLFSSPNSDISPAQIETYNRLLNTPTNVFQEEYEIWKERAGSSSREIGQNTAAPVVEKPDTDLPDSTMGAPSPTLLSEINDIKNTTPQEVKHIYPTPSNFIFPQNEVNVRSFEASIRHWGYTRKLARTTKGRLALVPEHTRPGDRVLLLYGGSVPYISRLNTKRGVLADIVYDVEGRYGEPGDRYEGWQPLEQFVGEAYVHGIMDGEAMLKIQVDGTRETEQDFWFE